MKREIFVLLFLGAIALASAVSGVSGIHSQGNGLEITLHPNTASRIWAGVWSVFFWAMAFGTHRRLLAAYYGGLALVAFSCLGFLVVAIPQILSLSQLPAALVAFILVGAVIGAAWTFIHWGRWWQRQRSHFVRHAG